MNRLAQSLRLFLLIVASTPPAFAASENGPDSVIPADAAVATRPPGKEGEIFRERPTRVWPIYYHRRFDDGTERSIYGPFTLAEDGGKRLRYPLWPLTGTTTGPEGVEKLDILWPFTRYSRTGPREDYSLLWPVTGYSRSTGGNEELTSLFLVKPILGYYSRTWSAGGGESSERAFAPFYFGTRHGASSFDYIFPSFIRSSDSAAGRNAHGLFPFYYYGASPESRSIFVMPSYFSKTGTTGKVTTLLPFFYDSASDDGSARWIFPSYLDINGPGTSAGGVIPFWFRKSSPEGKTLFVFPSYLGTSRANGYTASLLVPFYLRSVSPEDGESIRYILPTWFERTTRDSDMLLFPPFFTRSSHGTGASAGGHLSILWPAYFRWRSSDGTETSSALLNLYFRRENRAAGLRYRAYLWPLAMVSESPKERGYRIWPYGFSENIETGYRYHHFLWPLAGYGSGAGTTEAHFAPLLYHRSTADETTTVVVPLYAASETPQRRYSLLFPAWFRSASQGDRLTVTPLAVWGENASGSRYFYSLLYSNRSSGGSEMSVIPPAAWGGDPDGTRRFLLFPVYYRSWKGEEDSSTIFLNTWIARHGDYRGFSFFPLASRTSEPARRSTHVLNTWWRSGEKVEKLIFFPLAWYSSPPGEDRSDLTFFPLFNYETREGGDYTFSFLWRLYYQRQQKQEGLSAILWWLYRSESRPGFSRTLLWPFIDFERNSGEKEEVFRSFLLRFVVYERNAENVRVRLLGMPIYRNY